MTRVISLANNDMAGRTGNQITDKLLALRMPDEIYPQQCHRFDVGKLTRRSFIGNGVVMRMGEGPLDGRHPDYDDDRGCSSTGRYQSPNQQREN
ncbi:hypothetical protein AVEN_253592-1 [Araneus ventricosus]|uniref:Uncharacterized protein n=1 Tax=Araneus ventricosus TaxID=182803 RepID=A0A4Y2C9Z7_ARAVE|nr:hypothetical protein AVEN_253592-1 [Araneus ventricosus]